MDPVIELVVCYALALLWFSAATQKILFFERFSVTLNEYRLLPESAVAFFSVAVAGLEVILGIGLLMPLTRLSAFLGSAGLLGIYAAAIGVNLMRGRRHIDCGCMGPVRQLLSGWLVWRNILVAGMALICLVPVRSRDLSWIDGVSIVAAVGVLALVYVTVNQLIFNAPELARLRR